MKMEFYSIFQQDKLHSLEWMLTAAWKSARSSLMTLRSPGQRDFIAGSPSMWWPLNPAKKYALVGQHKIMDQEAIYARVICILVSNRDFDLQKVLSSELAAYPPSMFHPNGSMRLATSKSTLKNNLAVEVALRNWGAPWCLCLSLDNWLAYKGLSPENWSTTSAPKLYSLPPTTEAFVQNLSRCHYQVAQW